MKLRQLLQVRPARIESPIFFPRGRRSKRVRAARRARPRRGGKAWSRRAGRDGTGDLFVLTGQRCAERRRLPRLNAAVALFRLERVTAPGVVYKRERRVFALVGSFTLYDIVPRLERRDQRQFLFVGFPLLGAYDLAYLTLQQFLLPRSQLVQRRFGPRIRGELGLRRQLVPILFQRLRECVLTFTALTGLRRTVGAVEAKSGC